MIRCEPRRSRAIPANFVQARQTRVRNTIERPTLPEVAALVAAARPSFGAANRRCAGAAI
jgi:hypothetical protein